MAWRLAFLLLLPATAWTQPAGMSDDLTPPPPMTTTPPPVEAPPTPNVGMEPLRLKLDGEMPVTETVESPPPPDAEPVGHQDESDEHEPVVLTPAE